MWGINIDLEAVIYLIIGASFGSFLTYYFTVKAKKEEIKFRVKFETYTKIANIIDDITLLSEEYFKLEKKDPKRAKEKDEEIRKKYLELNENQNMLLMTFIENSEKLKRKPILKGEEELTTN